MPRVNFSSLSLANRDGVCFFVKEITNPIKITSLSNFITGDVLIFLCAAESFDIYVQFFKTFAVLELTDSLPTSVLIVFSAVVRHSYLSIILKRFLLFSNTD